MGTDSPGDISVPEEGGGAARRFLPSAAQTPEGQGRCQGPGPALCGDCPGTGLARRGGRRDAAPLPFLPPLPAPAARPGFQQQGRLGVLGGPICPGPGGSAGRCRLRGAAARWRCALRNGASALPPPPPCGAAGVTAPLVVRCCWAASASKHARR